MKDLDEKGCRLMSALQEMIIKMQEVDDTCVELSEDISKKELGIISFVGDNKNVIMRHIAEYLQVPMSTTTGIVDKLVSNKKYLARQHSSEDRRSIQIILTEKGQEAHNLLSNLRLNMTRRIMADLDDHEVDNLIHLLEKITGNLHKYVPA